jgi:Lrp/AsnC family transcriptional regulator, regulator for asnA, asnC and gidA
MENRIDKLDKKILSIITHNARIPFKDVAAQCGVSRAAIHQRVQRMIDLGVIIGSGYFVDAKKLKYTTCTYIGIYLEKGWMYEEVVKELLKIPEIVECHYTTGQYSIFAKVYARDNEDLKAVLNNKLQAIKGISSTETFISLEQRFKREIPITEDEEEIS